MTISLKSKVNILIAAITLVTGISLNLMFNAHYIKMAKADVEERAMEISRLEGWDLTEHYERREFEQLYTQIIADINAIQHVTDIHFYGRNGHLIIDKDGKKRLLSADRWIQRGIESQSMMHEWNGLVFRHFEPIVREKEVIGFLCIEYNAGFLSRQLHKIMVVTMSTTAVLTLIFIAAGIAFSRRLISPLTAITSAAKKVAGGDLSAYVTFKSNDQLGILAQNFNIMVERLKSYIAERASAEAELRTAIAKIKDEKARSTAIIEAIGDGISIQSTDFKILYQNHIHRDAAGEHVGEHCYAAYDHRDDVCEGCPVAAAFADDKIHTLEKSVPGRRGIRRIEIIASSLKDSTGRIIAGIEVVRDVSERRQVNDSLKLLKEAVEALPIGITITDTARTIIYVNTAEAEMHGWHRDKLIGESSRVLAPRNSWKPMPFEQLHAVGLWKRESVNIRSNGEVFPVQLTSIAVKNSSGAPIGIITACEDITERKQAHEKLLQRQEALHAVYKIATTLDSSFKSMCDEITSSLSRLLDVSHVLVLKRENDKMKVISGIADRRLLTSEVAACPPDCTCEILHGKKKITQYTGTLKDICPHHPFSDDDLKTLLCVPVTNTEGSVVGVVTIADRTGYDITEGKIQLVEIFSRYAGFVIEREGMEEKLRAAQKLEVFGKLASVVAHEVRNPLSAIIAITEALYTDLGENREYRPFLDHIHSQVDRLSILMQDLLDLGKPVGQLDMKQESLYEICSASKDLWEHTGRVRTHKVKIGNRTVCPPLIIADTRRLQQVFLNLLDNAAQHSPEGSEIQIVIHEPAEKMCRVQIIDRGSGISEETMPHVFDPFFSTRQGGVGLGMSIVKQIVESHRGKVTIVNNDPPPGSSVDIRLPIAEGREL